MLAGRELESRGREIVNEDDYMVVHKTIKTFNTTKTSPSEWDFLYIFYFVWSVSVLSNAEISQDFYLLPNITVRLYMKGKA